MGDTQGLAALLALALIAGACSTGQTVAPATPGSAIASPMADSDPAEDVAVAPPYRLTAVDDAAGQRLVSAIEQSVDAGPGHIGARYVKNDEFGPGFFAYLFAVDLSESSDQAESYDDRVRSLTASGQAHIEARDVDGVAVTFATMGSTGLAMYRDGDLMVLVTCADRMVVPSLVESLIAAR